MSIFFDFDVGPNGKRFRRAVDADKYDIDAFCLRERTDKVFGNVDLGSLIELSTLAICMINEKKDVVGFMALDDHPNIPGLDPSDWEVWMRNMFQKYYTSRNTLFVHFMCCMDSVRDTFLDHAWHSVFINDAYLSFIILVMPPTCNEDDFITTFKTFKKRNIYKYCARRDDDSNLPHCLYTAMRQEFCPKLKVRRAVEEDNDDIVEILDKKCPQLKQLYGKYYVSEIIGRHPQSKRKVIVADYQERAIGVACLSSEICYEALQNSYEVSTFHGLVKTTPLEKEKRKRNNNLLKTFGEPIMTGKFSPFQPIEVITSDKSSVDADGDEKEKELKGRATKSKVNFRKASLPGLSLRHSFEQIYHHQSQDDTSDVYMGSLSPSENSNRSIYIDMLEGDSFDYEIVNIDPYLLKMPDAYSLNLSNSNKHFNKESKVNENQNQNVSRNPHNTRQRKASQSTLISWEASDHSIQYQGEENAFMIELFGLREDFDDRHSFDLLEGAFEIMKTYDYCILRIPSHEKSFALLQHFCFVPPKPNVSSEFALYIAHKSSVFCKLRTRRAEFVDIPQIAQIMQNLDGPETVWAIEHSILNRKNQNVYVFLNGQTLIGFAIMEPPEQIDFIRAKYNLEPYYIHKYHVKGNDICDGFSTLKVSMVYPVFEVHYKYFMREVMRLSGTTNLIWLTAYRNKWIINKANTMISSMIPIMPRKSEIDCVEVPDLRKYNNLHQNITPFSVWFMSKNLTSVGKANIDSRIVIIGASRTAMAFLDTLLFSDTASYITFTNLTLISRYGLPYMRQHKAALENMFLKYRTSSDKYLKSVPYTYYVNVIQGTMVEINKKEKYVGLRNGTKCPYDLLFLFMGKQYQHPDYLKPVLERDRDLQTGKSPSYVRLDVPKYSFTEFHIFDHDSPDNVFIINNINEANKAINYIKTFSWNDYDYNGDYIGGKDNIIVYGFTIHAYCCLFALLEMDVPPDKIIFVEPFPSLNPRKLRVPVFCNEYVDQTVQQVMENLNIKIYRSFHFQSWTLENDNTISQVEFLSHFKQINLQCSVFFYYGTRGIDEHAFVAISKSGIVYNDGILIDHQFRTRDPSIFAAGPNTRYFSTYCADNRRQKFHDSYEIGQKIGIQIRNSLDPMFTATVCVTDEKRMSASSDLLESIPSKNSNSTDNSSRSTQKLLSLSRSLSMKNDANDGIPELLKPIVIHCKLPGGLQYLDVRAPGYKIPHHYVQSLEWNGLVMETFQRGYFKLHLNKDMVVDGVTCLTKQRCSVDNFKNLYGLSATVLNNVHIKYTTKKLSCFYEYFESPWASFLYHDNCHELFLMARELLPQIERRLTLKEALHSVIENCSNKSLRSSIMSNIFSYFEKSPYVEAVTNFVIEWLSENDILLPVYLQPWQTSDYSYDNGRNPFFIKRNET